MSPKHPKGKPGKHFWMLQLRTVFPYGLIDYLSDEFKIPERRALIWRKFLSLPRIHHRLSPDSYDTEGFSFLMNSFSNLTILLIMIFPISSIFHIFP